MPAIDMFLKILNERRGSDLHLSVGCKPCLRVNGRLEQLPASALTNETLDVLLREITPPAKQEEYDASGDVDFSYVVPDLARYRVNFFRQDRGRGATFREIPRTISSLESLGLPQALTDLAMLPKGLVLVTGPTGSGKSTTLAALIDYANRQRQNHIITIEDPIEFVHEPKKCLVNQREVGRDTKSFSAALRGALREDPDIILVGEMRDLETISLALEAAETGHLVFSTLHTISASKTVDRIIEVFPPTMQNQIRMSLSESLQGVISQTLFRRANGGGRVPALEIMLGTHAVRSLIREGKSHQLNGVLQTGKSHGMQALDDDIARLLDSETITMAEAANFITDKQRFKLHANGSA